MKKLLLTILVGCFVFVSAVTAGEITNIYTLQVIRTEQDTELKSVGVSRYTIRYVTSVVQTNNSTYVMEEPREGSGLSYRGSYDRTVLWPDDFADVGDIICKTNIGGKVYLYATPKQAEPTGSVLGRLKKKREEQ